MGRLQMDFWGASFVMGLEESASAQAPAVTGFEAGKIELGPRSAQVITDILGIGQKLGCHNSANRVAALILGAGIAGAITKEPCQGIA